MKKKTCKVVFHRCYEVPIEKVYEYWERLETERDLLTETDIKNGAEAVARDWLSDEMSEFLDNSEDFVSATVEIKD